MQQSNSGISYTSYTAGSDTPRVLKIQIPVKKIPISELLTSLPRDKVTEDIFFPLQTKSQENI